MPVKTSSNYFKSSARIEEKNTKKTLNRFKKEFKFYERYINLLYDVIVDVSKATKSKPLSGSKAVIFSMLPRLVGTMQSMRILNLKGYYYDERILGRSILENFGLCTYLSENEEEAKNWLDGKDIKISKTRLYYELGSFMMGERKEEYKKEANAEYGKLSCYVHANVRAIASSFMGKSKKATAKSKKGQVEWRFPPFFKEEWVTSIALFPIILLFVVMGLFKNELGNERIEKITNALMEYEEYAE